MKNILTNNDKEDLSKLLKVKFIKNIKNRNKESLSQSLLNHTSKNIKLLSKEDKNKMTKINKSIDNKIINKSNNKISQTFKYLPKRLLKINSNDNYSISNNIILSPILTYKSKINSNQKYHKILKQILYSPKQDFSIIKNVNEMKFRNEHILKFGNYANIFNSFKNNLELISNINKNYYLELLEKILKSLYNQSDLIFNFLCCLDKKEEKDIKIDINNLTQKLLSITEEHNNYLINSLIY